MQGEPCDTSRSRVMIYLSSITETCRNRLYKGVRVIDEKWGVIMKYAIIFLLAFTLLFSLFLMLLTRAAMAELKYLWIEKSLQRSGRRAADHRFDSR